MTIYDSLFPLGIGTNRFSVKSADDTEGIEHSAKLVSDALSAGASYVDVAHTYSKGTAMEICRRAFAQTDAPLHVTVKSSFLTDWTSDDALRRVEFVFDRLGIDHAAYFVCWNIASYAQFQDIMRKDSLYAGADKAKERGLIEHISFSTHAPPRDIIKMLDSGAFEGVTLSFSALNGPIMKPVLDCAEKNGVGVVVMNPLGGGLIPQNREYFYFLRGAPEESISQAALRYAYAHPAVKIVLSGMSSERELQENLSAFRDADAETPQARRDRVNDHFSALEGFCTGCRYCDGCPQNVNIYELMQAYNSTLFPQAKERYGRQDPQLLRTIEICARLKNTFGFMPSEAENPCVACGKCEEHCTAHLPIIQRIRELYRIFSESCFSRKGMLERLKQLIDGKRKIAFYPGGGYTAYVLELLRGAFPGAKFELFIFDSNPSVWGSTVGGIVVRDPEELPSCVPELVIVSNYNYSEEICLSLEKRLQGAIPVAKLHAERDVPWVY